MGFSQVLDSRRRPFPPSPSRRLRALSLAAARPLAPRCRTGLCRPSPRRGIPQQRRARPGPAPPRRARRAVASRRWGVGMAPPLSSEAASRAGALAPAAPHAGGRALARAGSRLGSWLVGARRESRGGSGDGPAPAAAHRALRAFAPRLLPAGRPPSPPARSQPGAGPAVPSGALSAGGDHVYWAAGAAAAAVTTGRAARATAARRQQ